MEMNFHTLPVFCVSRTLCYCTIIENIVQDRQKNNDINLTIVQKQQHQKIITPNQKMMSITKKKTVLG